MRAYLLISIAGPGTAMVNEAMPERAVLGAHAAQREFGMSARIARRQQPELVFAVISLAPDKAFDLAAVRIDNARIVGDQGTRRLHRRRSGGQQYGQGD